MSLEDNKQKRIRCVDAQGRYHFFLANRFVDRKSVYGILIEKGEILLVQDVWSKRWSLPGGGIDLGEDEQDALVREFMEETNLRVTVIEKQLLVDISYFMPSTEPNPWKSYRSVYQVERNSGLVRSSGNNEDVLQVKYVPVAQAITLMRASHNDRPFGVLLEQLCGL